MPVVPEMEVRAPNKRKSNSFTIKPRARDPRINKNEKHPSRTETKVVDDGSVVIVSKTTKVIDGVTFQVLRLAPRPAGAMLDSKTIWDDGPRKRRIW